MIEKYARITRVAAGPRLAGAMALALLPGLPVQAAVRFVDASAPPGGDGLSWATAHQSLDAALVEAAGEPAIEQVWIAAGVYVPRLPAVPGQPRSAAFVVPDGLALYGGFAGGEDSLEERDPSLNPTVLSADLAGDDQPAFLNRADNAWHVMVVDGAVVRVDGLVFRGGRADAVGIANGESGGGLLVRLGGGTIVARCTFTGNEAGKGGGMAIIANAGAALVQVVNCTFTANRATATNPLADLGGGAFTQGGFDPVARFANCIFAANAAGFGGALMADHGGFDLINCTVAGNQSAGGPPFWGSAVELMGTFGFIRLHNSVLWGNTSANNPAGVELMQVHVPLPMFMLEVQHCCVQAWSGGFGGAGNFPDDPLFADESGPDGQPASGDEDLRLQGRSPCVDAGDDGLLPADAADLDLDGDALEPIPFDADGGPRVSGPSVDIGAFEVSACPADLSGGDSVVGVADLVALLLAWGSDGPGAALADPPDVIDVQDLVALLLQWGPCP